MARPNGGTQFIELSAPATLDKQATLKNEASASKSESYVAGSSSVRKAISYAQSMQRFTAEEERALAKRVLGTNSVDRRGLSIAKLVRRAALEKMKANGDQRDLGVNWQYKFLSRHPQVTTLYKIRSKRMLEAAAPISALRTTAAAGSHSYSVTPWAAALDDTMSRDPVHGSASSPAIDPNRPTTPINAKEVDELVHVKILAENLDKQGMYAMAVEKLAKAAKYAMADAESVRSDNRALLEMIAHYHQDDLTHTSSLTRRTERRREE